MRSPFTPSGHTLAELDALHAAVGLGAEWLTSDTRRDLADAGTVPGEVIQPCQSCPFAACADCAWQNPKETDDARL